MRGAKRIRLLPRTRLLTVVQMTANSRYFCGIFTGNPFVIHLVGVNFCKDYNFY